MRASWKQAAANPASRAALSQAGELHSHRWGLLMRAGADKSYLARQIERYADIYTSRVSNFGGYTPFVFLRAGRVSLPHDGADGSAGDHFTP